MNAHKVKDSSLMNGWIVLRNCNTQHFCHMKQQKHLCFQKLSYLA